MRLPTYALIAAMAIVAATGCSGKSSNAQNSSGKHRRECRPQPASTEDAVEQPRAGDDRNRGVRRCDRRCADVSRRHGASVWNDRIGGRRSNRHR